MSDVAYGRKFHIDNVEEKLDKFAEKMIPETYSVEYIHLDPNTNDSYIQSYPVSPLIVFPKPKHLKFDCTIGVKCLVDNIDKKGYVRDIDLAYCAKHIAHEAQHLYRNKETYQEPLFGYSLDMARIDFLSGNFDGYKRNMYWCNPAEIDAEIHGLLDTVKYFKEIPNIKACLFEKYKELPTNRVWNSRKPVTNFDDMISSLEEQKYLYLYADRGFPFRKDSIRDKVALEKLDICSAWQDVLHAENTVGVQYDEKLFAMAIDLSELWVQTHRGIKDEAKRLREKYPKQLPTPMDETLDDALKFLNKLRLHDGEEL